MIVDAGQIELMWVTLHCTIITLELWGSSCGGHWVVFAQNDLGQNHLQIK